LISRQSRRAASRPVGPAAAPSVWRCKRRMLRCYGCIGGSP
jgi:hypothetical protein